MLMHAQVTVVDWAWWIGLLLGVVPLLALAVWHSNDVCHCAFFTLKRWRRRARLPPGHMGLPFVGESLWLLWYYKLARLPDGFVHTRRRRYYAGGPRERRGRVPDAPLWLADRPRLLAGGQ